MKTAPSQEQANASALKPGSMLKCSADIFLILVKIDLHLNNGLSNIRNF